MDRPVLPADLSALSAAELLELGAQIKTYLFHVRSTVDLTAETVTELESVRADYDAVNAAAAARVDADTDLAARTAASFADLTEPDTADDAEDEDGGSEGKDEVDAAAEVEPVAEVKEVAAAVTRDALGQLATRQKNDPRMKHTAPQPTPSSPKGSGVFAARRAGDTDENAEFGSMREFAAAMADIRNRMGRLTMAGARSYEYVGRTSTLPDPGPGESIPTLQGDAVSNYSMLEDASNRRALTETLVASGVLCPPDNPMYDFFRTAQVLNPVESALSVVGAPRGAIRYIRSPDFRAARAAIGTRTAAENVVASPAKPCARVTCPTVLEATVTAVSECVLFDNLGYRAFPELTENFMADVAVSFAAVKECLYLTDIDAASTAVTSAIPAYGAARAFFFQLHVAAAGYRKRHNMARNALLQGIFPSWLPDMLAADMANDASLGIANLAVSEAQIAQIFANLNVSPVWMNDQANCSTTNAALDLQAWRAAQAAGLLNAFPTTAVWYLFAPGTFVRLDAGTLDVGLVRDSVLNGTNDLEIFMEQWVGTVKLGNESIKVTSTLIANGTAPVAVAAMAAAV